MTSSLLFLAQATTLTRTLHLQLSCQDSWPQPQARDHEDLSPLSCQCLEISAGWQRRGSLYLLKSVGPFKFFISIENTSVLTGGNFSCHLPHLQ